MSHIVILSSSVRIDRKSHRVALFFKKYIEKKHRASVEIVDLKEYQFPVFEERLKFLKNPSEKMLEFKEKIVRADGILIVTPEYNGGYPAALKNVVDLLYEEWYRKPTAVSTVSGGAFGGMQAIVSLQFILWKMKAWVVPAMFPVPKVQESYDEDGNPNNEAETEKLAEAFINELLWCMEAKAKMS